jgi:hypothetical protein
MSRPEYDSIMQAIESTHQHGQRVPLETLRTWMNSPRLSAQSAAFDVLFEHPEYVDAPSEAETTSFYLRYFTRALQEDPASQGLPGPYVMAHSMRAWFERLWRQRPVSEAALLRLRESIADLVRSGNERTRDVLIIGFLEHVLGKADQAAFFAAWEADPILGEVYKTALELA